MLMSFSNDNLREGMMDFLATLPICPAGLGLPEPNRGLCDSGSLLPHAACMECWGQVVGTVIRGDGMGIIFDSREQMGYFLEAITEHRELDKCPGNYGLQEFSPWSTPQECCPGACAGCWKSAVRMEVKDEGYI